MADAKISALPVVVAELDTDQFACVNGAATKMETRAQIVSTVAAGLAADVANLAAHIAVTTTPIHGSSAAAGANTLAHRNAAGDLAATDFNAVAGTAANPSHTFTADPDTGLYRYAANELGIATVGAHRAHWNMTGAVILNNAAASTFMTGPGVTIQQGAYDDEAIAIKSTDVAHGMTVQANTDTYFRIQKQEAAAGGANLSGFKDAAGYAGGAIILAGYLGENADTDKTVAARAIVEAIGYIKSGASIGNTNADGNVFAVRTWRGGAAVTLLIVDEDGDLWLDGTLNAPRTRKFFVPCVEAYHHEDIPPESALPNQRGWVYPDGGKVSGYGYFTVPEDFVSGMTIKVVVDPAANGNGYFMHRVFYGLCTEAYATHSHSTFPAASYLGIVAVTQNNHNCIMSLAMTNAAAGDIVHCLFRREADDVADTINADCWFTGWVVEYTSDS